MRFAAGRAQTLPLHACAGAIARDTDDREGAIIGESAVRPDASRDRGDAAALHRHDRAAAAGLFRDQDRRAPRLCAGPRRPAARYCAARPVEIAELRLIALPDPDHAEFEAVVGKGTYIRSLARDLAEALGTLGHVVELRRLAVGRFTEDQAISLDSALALGHSPAASGHLLPIETALDDIPALALTADEAARLRHGQPVTPRDHASGRGSTGSTTARSSAPRHDRLLVALARIEDGALRPVRVINR